ncbi:CHRD domain-containing protein [Pseudonocardia nigra]|uniref:CHRD domain-containing protein n=1 Tax=Pseudonocardia nigra TaxID=1921578 RepID=UPI001C5F6F6A|nr:CHRD domain-containing protein [Pseudonocardia nigra]
MRLTKTLGAVAGALLLVGLSTGVAVAQDEETMTFTASGSGEEEIPAGSGQAGATVAGTFTLSADDTLTYTVSIEGNDEPVTAGHIHQGAAGVNGDVVVMLDAAAITAGSEATAEVPAEVADALRADPSGFYLNTHSASFAPPTGVARAQLSADGATAPSSVPTGTGGQAADGVDTTALAGLGVAAAVAAGAVVLVRRRRAS